VLDWGAVQSAEDQCCERAPFSVSQTDDDQSELCHRHASSGFGGSVFRTECVEHAELARKLCFSASMSLRAGTFSAPTEITVIAVTAEFFGGLSLIVGFFARVVAAGIAMNAVMAILMVDSNDGSSRSARRPT
jgi:hypothetical protein